MAAIVKLSQVLIRYYTLKGGDITGRSDTPRSGLTWSDVKREIRGRGRERKHH